MKPNLGEIGKHFVTAAAVLGIGYGVALKSGYVVDEAGAGEIAQQKANIVADSIADEAVKRERADLRLQLDVTLKELEYLYTIQTPNSSETLQRQIKLDQVNSIRKRLAELDQ